MRATRKALPSASSARGLHSGDQAALGKCSSDTIGPSLPFHHGFDSTFFMRLRSRLYLPASATFCLSVRIFPAC